MKPAGGRAGVERPAPGHGSTAKRSRAASSFSPPRPTNRGGGPTSSTGSAGVDQAGRLGGRGAADEHPAGGDVVPGPLAGRRQAPPDQLGVEPTPHGSAGATSAAHDEPGVAFLAVRFAVPDAFLAVPEAFLAAVLRGGRRLPGRRLLAPGPCVAVFLAPDAFLAAVFLAPRPCGWRCAWPAWPGSGGDSPRRAGPAMSSRLARPRAATCSRISLRTCLEQPLGVLPAAVDDLLHGRLGLLGWTSPALTRSLTIASARSWVIWVKATPGVEVGVGAGRWPRAWRDR